MPIKRHIKINLDNYSVEMLSSHQPEEPEHDTVYIDMKMRQSSMNNIITHFQKWFDSKRRSIIFQEKKQLNITSVFI